MIRRHFAALFGHWEPQSPARIFPPNLADVSNYKQRYGSSEPIQFYVELVERLSWEPEGKCLYGGETDDKQADSDGLTIFERADSLFFHFADGGLVRVWLDGSKARQEKLVKGCITANLLNTGRLEDLFYTTLAPLLRRQRIFLIHAFAAVRDEEALLLVGPSNSGKTTTGLRLVFDGWQFLANDVVMLRQKEDQIYALPTPGSLSISQETIRKVPELSARLGEPVSDEPHRKRVVPMNKVIEQWGQAAPVRRIFFPSISGRNKNELNQSGEAQSLAILAENSLDRWDAVCLPDHLKLLERLSLQSQRYELFLGQNLDQLAELVAGV